MSRHKFTGKLQELIEKAETGEVVDVDFIMSHLTSESTFELTRYVDFALSLVDNINGISRIEYLHQFHNLEIILRTYRKNIR